MTTTVNYGLRKPDLSEHYSVGDSNYNSDIIDSKMNENASGVSANAATASSNSQGVLDNASGVSANAAEIVDLQNGKLDANATAKNSEKVGNIPANNVIEENGRVVTDLNNYLTSVKSGFYGLNNATTNTPSGVYNNYCSLITAKNQDTGLQILGGYRGNQMYFRGWAGADIYDWYRIWHDGNDGANSGLDADLWRGQTPDYFATKAEQDEVTYKNSYLDLQEAEGWTKEITFEDPSDWTLVNAYPPTTVSEGAKTFFKRGSVRLTNTNGLAGGLGIYKNIDLNLTYFNNGASSNVEETTTGDGEFIRFAFYVSNRDSMGEKIQVLFSNERNNVVVDYLIYSVLKVDIVTGWNFVDIPTENFSTIEGGAWDLIRSVRVYFNTLEGFPNSYVEFLSVQLIRRQNGKPNPFPKHDILEGKIYVGYDMGKLVGRNLDILNYHTATIVPKTSLSNFKATSTVKGMIHGSLSRGISWYVDANNYIRGVIEANTLKLLFTVGGTSYSTERPFIVLPMETLHWTLEKVGAFVELSVFKNSDPSTSKSLRSSGSFGNLSGRVSIPQEGGVLTEFTDLSVVEVSPDDLGHSYHSSVAEVAKTLRAMPSARYCKETSQGILQNSLTVVTFSKTIHENKIVNSDWGFEIPEDGRYLITFSARIRNSTTGYLALNATDNVSAATNVNDDSLAFNSFNVEATESAQVTAISRRLVVGEKVYPIIYIGSSGNSIMEEGYASYFEILKVGE